MEGCGLVTLVFRHCREHLLLRGLMHPLVLCLHLHLHVHVHRPGHELRHGRRCLRRHVGVGLWWAEVWGTRVGGSLHWRTLHDHTLICIWYCFRRLGASAQAIPRLTITILRPAVILKTLTNPITRHNLPMVHCGTPR